MKTCPSCSEEVPVAASRCKHCFHDFTEEPVKKTNRLVGLLLLVFLMLVAGAGTFWYITTRTADKIVVDKETQSIVFTHTSATGTTTQRVPFAQITHVEHVVGGETMMFEVVAVGTDGTRYILKSSGDKPQRGEAEHDAAVMGKEFKEVRNVKGFGEY